MQNTSQYSGSFSQPEGTFLRRDTCLRFERLNSRQIKTWSPCFAIFCFHYSPIATFKWHSAFDILPADLYALLLNQLLINKMVRYPAQVLTRNKGNHHYFDPTLDRKQTQHDFCSSVRENLRQLDLFRVEDWSNFDYLISKKVNGRISRIEFKNLSFILSNHSLIIDKSNIYPLLGYKV